MTFYPYQDDKSHFMMMSIGDNFEVGVGNILSEMVRDGGIRPAQLDRLCVDKSMFYAEWGTATWGGARWTMDAIYSTKSPDTPISASLIAHEGTLVEQFSPGVSFVDALATTRAMGATANASIEKDGARSPFKYCLLSKEGIGMNCQTWTQACVGYLKRGETPPWVRVVNSADGGCALVNIGGEYARIEMMLARAAIASQHLLNLKTTVAETEITCPGTVVNGYTANRTLTAIHASMVAKMATVNTNAAAWRATAVMARGPVMEVSIGKSTPLLLSNLGAHGWKQVVGSKHLR